MTQALTVGPSGCEQRLGPLARHAPCQQPQKLISPQDRRSFDVAEAAGSLTTLRAPTLALWVGIANPPRHPETWSRTSVVVMYVRHMSLAEHTFTHMLRNSGEVLAEVERRDVVLRRRDGEDLFLGLRSREESVRDALGILARLLVAASVDPMTRSRVAGALVASLPWAGFLPDHERVEFVNTLASTAAACVDLGTFEPLAQLIDGWRATAEVHANPDLVGLLNVPRSGPTVKLKRPKAS